MQNTAVQSPPFGYLSPPIDGCDACSEDGDPIQTPQTEHETHQPYAVYHQNQHLFSHGLFNGDKHHESPEGSAKPESVHTTFSALLTPSASDKLHLAHASDAYLDFSPPDPLDLSNTSIEFDPFAASFAATFNIGGTGPQVFAQGAETYDDDSQHSFDFSPSATLAGESFNTSSDSMDILDLPSFSVSSEPLDTFDISEEMAQPLLLAPPSSSRPCAIRSPASENIMQTMGRIYSPRFPADHSLSPFFIGTYELGDELGAGGYGFVMTARHRMEGHEVAVKFIIKDKVPAHAWWDDELLGHVPTEVMIMTLVDHENIVKCMDLFEDELYFYLVQELHGTPWVSRKKTKQVSAPGKLVVPSPASTPSLTPSPSTDTDVSLPGTPLHVSVEIPSPTQPTVPQELGFDALTMCPGHEDSPDSNDTQSCQSYLQPPTPRPNFSRRASYDLFECIEQSKHKRLSEDNARYVFAQVVEAVHYLNTQGITHCDIKDENLVVDEDFKVKLIDFGSAVVADPSAPLPYYTLFYGTTAYASAEILRKQPYQAAPAEIWTLGVLLSYLLTGHSPFPTEKDAIDGRIVIHERGNAARPGRAALNLLARCLEVDPKRRANIEEVRSHRWLKGALDRDSHSD